MQVFVTVICSVLILEFGWRSYLCWFNGLIIKRRGLFPGPRAIDVTNVDSDLKLNYVMENGAVILFLVVVIFIIWKYGERINLSSKSRKT